MLPRDGPDDGVLERFPFAGVVPFAASRFVA